jgi:hypothetical protein
MATQNLHENLWAIVLAAGQGTRLSTITRALHGCDRPKQFAALSEGRTLLERTPVVKFVYQPCNRGAGAGVLLPLAQVLANDPGAKVVILHWIIALRWNRHYSHP